jgi:hypothetical protein
MSAAVRAVSTILTIEVLLSALPRDDDSTLEYEFLPLKPLSSKYL